MIYNCKEYNYNQIKEKVGGLFLSKYKRVVNNIITFDTETTSLYYIENEWQGFNYDLPPSYYTDNKVQSIGFVYVWTFAFEDVTYYGRTLEEFKSFILQIKSDIESDMHQENLELYIYVHNLPYDICFLYNIFEVKDSFQRKPHKPMYVKTVDGITFKDSYIYSNLSLASISKSNVIYKKQSGEEFDYTKIRYPWTPLSDYEMKYAEYDVLALWEYLTRERKNYLSRVTTMPLTNTGKVRKNLFKKIKKENSAHIYHCQKLVPTVERYKDLLQLFMGGVCHSNVIYNGRIMENVKSKDYTSSYPFVLLSEKYPVSTFMIWTGNQEKIINNNNYVWYATLTIKNFQTINAFPYLPAYKSMYSKGLKIDNGRIYKGEEFRMLVTNVDYQIIKENYTYESIELTNMYIAKADYLTDTERDYILDLYVNKTQYKDDPENVDLYANSKNMFNSMYGMQVTQLVAPEVVFNNETKEYDISEFNDDVMKEQLAKQRHDKKLITSFARGVWCTAYARYNLYLPLNKMNRMHVLYSDTDSVKYIEPVEGYYDAMFEEINQYNNQKLLNALNENQRTRVAPLDIHGKSHLIGELDTEKGYDRFITYGAKKYAYEQDGKLGITVAGLNKKKGAKKLKRLEDFKLGTVWDYKESGRTTATYQTNQPPITIDNHLINYRYGVVLQPATYTLGLSRDYSQFVKDAKGYVEFSENCVFRKE